MIGLSWALFVAGSPVVSQWKVESASTTQLMVEFHRQIFDPKIKHRSYRAEALRKPRNCGTALVQSPLLGRVCSRG